MSNISAISSRILSKNMVKRFIVIIVLIPFMLSCTKMVELDFESIEPEIVVNCLFTTGNYFNVQVMETSLFGDSSNAWITNADVTIKAQKKMEIRSLSYAENGYYCDTTFYPQYNETYTLEVNVPGYETVTATDSLPILPRAEVLEFYTTDRVDEETYNYKYNDFNIWLNDSVGYSNYYELACYEYLYLAKKREPNVVVGLESDEPFVKNEGDQELVLGSLYFSDELIDGRSFEFKVSAIASNLEDSSWHLDLHIIALSYDLYRFRKTFLRHYSAQDPEFFTMTEPVPMYTNIENGYGIFAAYSYIKFTCYPENK
jgi:hypothetical protein